MAVRAFISYSSSDRAFVTRLAEDLRTREGIDAWLDQWEINPGDRILEKIEEGLSDADVFVLVLSPESVGSTWVERERQAWVMMQTDEEKRAEEERRRPARRLIPVLYRDCEKPPFLKAVEHVRITDEDYEDGLEQLVSAMLGIRVKPDLGKGVAPPVSAPPRGARRKYALTLLKALLPGQFDQVGFVYNMPSAHLPASAPQVQKAIALIEYAEKREGAEISGLLDCIYRAAPHLRGAPEELLARLKRLLPGQLEQLEPRLGIDFSYIRDTGTSPAQRANDLIRLVGQQEGGLTRLQALLDELNWFKEFVPEGAYPVGEQLLRREEAYERQAMEKAAARGENPQDYRVTPEMFFTFKPEAAWLGIFRGWDSPRSFHPELARHVVSRIQGRNTCPAAAIVGPGGSGKSVAMRRLGVYLASEGYKVWWVEEPERLLRFGLSQIVDTGEGPQFLLVDDIQSLDREWARRFQRDLATKQSLILIVSGRRLPPAFRTRLTTAPGLFKPDEAADRVSILGKIAELIPDWAEAAKQMAAEPLRKARLIRMLWVLARRKAAPRDLEELERRFLEILADDINGIRSILPGLAEAAVDAATIREVGYDISRKTFIALADYHQSGASIPTLLEGMDANARWRVVTPLLSYDPMYDALRFHHDELADGLIRAGQHGLLGSRVVGDNAWRKATLETILDRGSVFSSSWALAGCVRSSPPLVGEELALQYIRQLLASGNGHHAYLRLIVDKQLDLKQDERSELLLEAARVVPLNRWLWGTVWVWIRSHYPKKQDRADVLQGLYEKGCRAFNVLIPLLDNLPPAEGRRLARRWLVDPATEAQVRCRCLELLGTEAKPEALKLLANPATSPDVKCRCLDLLGEEAKPEARDLLANSTTPPDVKCRCLELLGTEARDEARGLLANSTTTPDVKCRCLPLLGEEAKPEALKLLANPATSPDVKCRCLDLLGEEAKPEARDLLANSTTPPELQCRCVDVLGKEVEGFAIEQIGAWPERNAALVARCFKVAAGRPQARKGAEEMLAAWDKPVPSLLRAAALRESSDSQLRIQRAQAVLDSWRRQYRPLVAAAIMVFDNDPGAVTECCRAILQRWHGEIAYRRAKRLPEYDGHIIKALSHPLLREESSRAVKDMLAEEAKCPRFLSPESRRWAEGIVEGEWPPWSGLQEGAS